MRVVSLQTGEICARYFIFSSARFQLSAADDESFRDVLKASVRHAWDYCTRTEILPLA